MFKLLKTSKKSRARLGLLKTARGIIRTPFFMPIATKGSVKALRTEDLKKLGAEIILSNTYHLFFKPGTQILKKAHGIHGLMDWRLPILTDSGGYQVFSLAGNKDYGGQKKNLVKITHSGVEFRSVYDGSKHMFTPKKVLEIQDAIGSDIRMVLDVCSPAKCSREQAEKDLAITLHWANEAAKLKKLYKKSLMFGIVQGALYKDLRLKSVIELNKMNFDGYAVGGLAVGESMAEMYKVLNYTVPVLPQDKPHYLMGVGYPEQILQAVKLGIDMFDCVIPTREARHGRLYGWAGSAKQKFFCPQLPPSSRRSLASLATARSGGPASDRKKFFLPSPTPINFYNTINITSAKFAKDFSPINAQSKLPELRNHSKAYLRHLFSAEEPLALQLATLNNVEFYLDLMAKIRQGIKNNSL